MTPEESGCCGHCFKLDIINPEEVSDLTFHAVGGTSTIITVTYVKDGQLYFSISYDCEQTFEPPEEVMPIAGILKDIQILTKGDQFVVTLKIEDNESKRDIKKAVSGWIYAEKIDSKKASSGYIYSKRNKFSYKACTVREPKAKGKLINVSLSFREYVDKETGERGEESVDHSFYLDDDGNICMDCDGHRCVI